MRVLLVEDFTPLRASLDQALREAGFSVDAARDGEYATRVAQSGDYDVIILDIVLPRKDGLTVLREMRQSGRRTPVLLLTARDTIEDRVVGLDAGADDYLVKPFALTELLARVRALTRRRYEAPNPVIRVQDLEVDTISHTVKRGDDPITLTAREYALLEFLAFRAGQIVSRMAIWEHLYGFDSSVESNVVDVYVGYLRRKIERDGAPRLLHTRRGQGYVLE
ncbi:MAG: response regulator transcription factor [Phycisphaerales bacterium]|nr:response regulator transcription factor [Phycisphaerales bacterium]